MVGIEMRRIKMGMKRTELASLMGVGYNTVLRWERGARTPSINALKRISDILQCTLDELVNPTTTADLEKPTATQEKQKSTVPIGKK